MLSMFSGPYPPPPSSKSDIGDRKTMPEYIEGDAAESCAEDGPDARKI
jgi:hypothetical protein